MNAITPASSFVAAQPVVVSPDADLLAAGRKFDILMAAAGAAMETLSEEEVDMDEWCRLGVYLSEPAAIVARQILEMDVFTPEGRAVFIKAAEFVGGFRPDHIRH